VCHVPWQTLPPNGKPRHGQRRKRDDTTLGRFPPEPRVPSLTCVTFVEFSVLVPKLTHPVHTYIAWVREPHFLSPAP
jgi:hypothetical protein